MALIATKLTRYHNRALRAGDYFPKMPAARARLMVALGVARLEAAGKAADQAGAPRAAAVEDLTALRRAYRQALGKQAYHAWDGATLRRKIDEAGGAK